MKKQLKEQLPNSIEELKEEYEPVNDVDEFQVYDIGTLTEIDENYSEWMKLSGQLGEDYLRAYMLDSDDGAMQHLAMNFRCDERHFLVVFDNKMAHIQMPDLAGMNVASHFRFRYELGKIAGVPEEEQALTDLVLAKLDQEPTEPGDPVEVNNPTAAAAAAW